MLAFSALIVITNVQQTVAIDERYNYPRINGCRSRCNQLLTWGNMSTDNSSIFMEYNTIVTFATLMIPHL